MHLEVCDDASYMTNKRQRFAGKGCIIWSFVGSNPTNSNNCCGIQSWYLQGFAMKGVSVWDVALCLCLVFLIAPVHVYSFPDALKPKDAASGWKSPHLLSHPRRDRHLHPSREKAYSIQISSWEQTRARAAQEGRLRTKVCLQREREWQRWHWCCFIFKLVLFYM